MKFEFKPSFDRSVKSFHGREKEEIKQTALLAIEIVSRNKEQDFVKKWLNLTVLSSGRCVAAM